MKHAKKIASLLLALVMVLALTTTAFAADEIGSITVDKPRSDQTYTAFKIFDVTYNDDKSAYAYTIDSDATNNWFDEVKLYMGSNWDPATSTYTDGEVMLDATTGAFTGNGITLTPSATDNTVYVAEFTAEFSAPDFARFLNTKKTGKNGGTELTGDTTSVSANNLPLGYYFVTSISGALCNLTTTNPTVTIHDKNDIPFEKKDDQESVDVGQIVNYEIMGKVPDTTGFTSFDYVITDKMSEGLTFDKDSIKIYISDDDKLVTEEGEGKTTDQELDAKYYTKTVDDARNFEDTEDVDFSISFDALEMNKPDAGMVGKYIFITYTAKVNEKAVAVISENNAILTYSNDPTKTNSHGTQTDKETVYSAKIVIDKYAKQDEPVDGNEDTSKKLPGAKFVLYKKVTEGKDDEAKEVKKYYHCDENGVVSWGDREGAIEVTTKDDGAANFDGLADGTYYLEEIAAPAGYNMLKKPVEVIIEGTKTEDGVTSIVEVQLTQKAEVANSTGLELPSTGGMGTTIFYVVGSILLVGAAVLLVTKKRMSAAQ